MSGKHAEAIAMHVCSNELRYDAHQHHELHKSDEMKQIGTKTK